MINLGYAICSAYNERQIYVRLGHKNHYRWINRNKIHPDSVFSMTEWTPLEGNLILVDGDKDQILKIWDVITNTEIA